MYIILYAISVLSWPRYLIQLTCILISFHYFALFLGKSCTILIIIFELFQFKIADAPIWRVALVIIIIIIIIITFIYKAHI